MGNKSKAPGRKSHVKRKRSASRTPDKGTYVQREHKDRLFRFIFRDRKKLLQLYNALNESDYDDETELTVTTLENVLYLGYKNDVAFLLEQVLFLGEHQSSWNPNMPLECRALVLNINYGKNRKLMESCRPLHDYSLFVHRIREKLAEGYRPERAVDLAVEQCLREGVLSEELSASRKEVVGMFLEEYDAELHERTLREEGREEGRQEGRQEGRREGMQAGSRMMAELAKRLRADDRMEDFWKAVEDEKFCRRLLEEYGMNMTL
ncbi:MAG TPA: hypothetical protein IAA05_05420 [Candidatus Blautia excrementipullorum]|nr:hypothetical protein [Candidatus Blautia excrementipullorum]